MSLCLTAGLRATAAMEILASERRDPVFVHMCEGLRRELQSGNSYQKSFALFQQTAGLSRLQVDTLGLFETAGRMDVGFSLLSQQEEASWRLDQELKSALTYPLAAFTLCALFTLIIVPGFVIPNYLHILADMNVDTSHGLLAYLVPALRLTQQPMFWAFLLAGLALLAGLSASSLWRKVMLRSLIVALPIADLELVRKVRKKGGEEAIAQALLEVFCLEKVRPIGRLLQATWAARLSRGLQLVLDSGAPLTSQIHLLMEASGSKLLVCLRSDIRESLEGGAPLHQALRVANCLPPLFLQMVAVGEEVGDVSLLVSKAARIYEEQLTHFVQDALSLLEPVLLAAMGLLIGALALLMLLPMAEVVKSL